jgi:hypothetical protein
VTPQQCPGQGPYLSVYMYVCPGLFWFVRPVLPLLPVKQVAAVGWEWKGRAGTQVCSTLEYPECPRPLLDFLAARAGAGYGVRARRGARRDGNGWVQANTGCGCCGGCGWNCVDAGAHVWRCSRLSRAPATAGCVSKAQARRSPSEIQSGFKLSQCVKLPAGCG